jgi:hypothetical protein
LSAILQLLDFLRGGRRVRRTRALQGVVGLQGCFGGLLRRFCRFESALGQLAGLVYFVQPLLR